MVTFSYYDDIEHEAKTNADRLSNEKLNLKVIGKQAIEMHLIISEIKSDFSNRKINGVIFDLRLDNIEINKKKYLYRGTALAQELRTESSEDGVSNLDFPIILLSTETNLLKYNSDYSSHDLFDLIITKDKYNLEIEKIRHVQNIIISLANGYKIIKEYKSLKSIDRLLGLVEEDLSLIFPKFIYTLKQLMDKPVHVIARFIKNKLVEPQGLLIDRNVLMARLGIDESSSDANSIKLLFDTVLNKFKYTGVFSEGWERYWMELLTKWWEKEINPYKPINAFPASKRVEQIAEKMKLSRLKAATPIKTGFSEYFWTVSVISRKPLDPVNGYITISQYDPINQFSIMAENTEPWLDKNYVTKDEYILENASFKLILDSNDAKLIEED